MCDCKVLKRFDELYHICLCGHLHPILQPEPMAMPEKYVRLGTPIKEHCVHGHARTPDNVTKKGACKTCQRISGRKRLLDPAYRAFQKAYRGKSIEGITVIAFGSMIAP